MSLARLQAVLTNYSATINSAGTSLRALNVRLARVWDTLTNAQVNLLNIILIVVCQFRLENYQNTKKNHPNFFDSTDDIGLLSDFY